MTETQILQLVFYPLPLSKCVCRDRKRQNRPVWNALLPATQSFFLGQWIVYGVLADPCPGTLLHPLPPSHLFSRVDWSLRNSVLTTTQIKFNTRNFEYSWTPHWVMTHLFCQLKIFWTRFILINQCTNLLSALASTTPFSAPISSFSVQSVEKVYSKTIF